MRPAGWLVVPVAIAALLACGHARAADGESRTHADAVSEYIAAFNRRDLEALLQHVTDDVQWLSVVGDKVVVETQGKEQLKASLTAYFKSMPSARSALEWTRESSARVAAFERASWEGKSGAKSQASLCVYEFRDGLIARVYYFPVEP